MAAWPATARSSFRSSWVNFLWRSWVSSWMTPNALPVLRMVSGATMTERIRQVGDALAEVETLVGGGVLAQQRLGGFEAFVDDTAAEAGVGLVGGAARLDDLRDEPVGALLAEDDETAVAVLEDLEKALGDLRQQLVEVERLRQFGTDAQQPGEPLGGLRLEDLLARVANGGLDGAGAFLLLGLGGRGRPRRRPASRRGWAAGWGPPDRGTRCRRS